MKFIKHKMMSKHKSKAPHKEDTQEKEPVNTEEKAENSDNYSGNTSDTSENMTADASSESSTPSDNQEQLQSQVRDWQEKYLRLSADFDNFRKRTMREKMDLIKTAGEETFLSILPIIDDFERAIKAMENTTDIDAVKEGVSLIYNKFKETLNQKGVKAIDAQNQEFNTDLHEAITKIPAPDESLKGKVVDVVQKGYYLHDKVIRYAKVVVGE
jgi:molecular chaperone GrpE